MSQLIICHRGKNAIYRQNVGYLQLLIMNDILPKFILVEERKKTNVERSYIYLLLYLIVTYRIINGFAEI